MSLNRISCRNCKLCLLPGVKCIHLRREHKDFGELMMMGGLGVKGKYCQKKEVEPGHGASGGGSSHDLALCPSNRLSTRFQKNEILPFVATCKELEGITVSEIRQTKTNTGG